MEYFLRIVFESIYNVFASMTIDVRDTRCHYPKILCLEIPIMYL